MSRRSALYALAAAMLVAAVFPVASLAQEDIRCLACHGKPDFKKVSPSGKVLDLFVDPKLVRLSVHKDRTCVDCHSDVNEVPHQSRPLAVNCRRCHYLGNTEGAPQLGRYAEFQESVHGKAVLSGNAKAPACQDCHGDHFIQAGTDPRSSVSRDHVPRTCGACHLQTYAQYQASVHGAAMAKAVKDAPVCTDCHGEHNILRAGDASSTVNPGQVANTCARCHAKVFIMEKYGVKAEQVATYQESFHGIANEFGELKAANCASCHTAHDILPSDDPRSSVSKENIPRTCGKCHPGANANFAKGRIHINPKDRSAGAVYWVSLAFKVLTLSTLAGLFAHIGLDLFRRYRNRRRESRSGGSRKAEVNP